MSKLRHTYGRPVINSVRDGWSKDKRVEVSYLGILAGDQEGGFKLYRIGQKDFPSVAVDVWLADQLVQENWRETTDKLVWQGIISIPTGTWNRIQRLPGNDLVLSGAFCPYCGQETTVREDSKVYGRSYRGHVWICDECQAWVGCHPGTFLALGRLADKELRQWKQTAHKWFDPLWKKKIQQGGSKKHEARNAGYRWLAGELEIPVEKCHIAYFTVEQCQQVVEACKPYFKIQ